MPGILAWPLLVFIALVLAGRYRWCNNNFYDRYFNSTLAFLLAAQVLREHLVQHLLVTTAFMTLPGTWQLATAVLSYSYTEFVGFTMLWSGMSESETRRKHRYYRLAGVLLVLGFLVAGTSARIAAEPIEFTRGWESVLTLPCVTAMLMVLAVRIILLSVRELRIAARRRERLIAISTLSMGVAGVFNVVQEAGLQLSDQLGWTDTAHFRQQYHSNGLFFMIVGVFATAAVPLASRLARSLGLDPISRNWHKLQPLRHALRNVMPDCAFDIDDDAPQRRQKTGLQLHHTVVEIRDAILGLRPYIRELPEHARTHFLGKPSAVPAPEHDAAMAALHLAEAARAKSAGIAPAPVDPDSALLVASRAATLHQEAAELVALAKWWPAACAATEHRIDTAANTKANLPT